MCLHHLLITVSTLCIKRGPGFSPALAKFALDSAMSAIRNKLLVLNAGSSSLKYKLFQLGVNSALKAVASGVCERIGDAAASFHRVSDLTGSTDPSTALHHRVGPALCAATAAAASETAPTHLLSRRLCRRPCPAGSVPQSQL